MPGATLHAVEAMLMAGWMCPCPDSRAGVTTATVVANSGEVATVGRCASSNSNNSNNSNSSNSRRQHEK
eukprot:10916127-Lingulodinium_polyedra.AAC.1